MYYDKIEELTNDIAEWLKNTNMSESDMNKINKSYKRLRELLEKAESLKK